MTTYINPGLDASGNGNNWTTNNINWTSSGSTFDTMTDVPTLTSATASNFCVMNPVAKNSSLTIQDGNLYCTSASSNVGASGTLGVSTGKWYWEATRVTGTTGQPMVGIVTSGWDLSYVGSFAGGYAYDASGNKYNNANPTAYGATYTAGDVIGIALDLDAGTITFYKNNVSQGVAFSGLSGEFFPALSVQNNAFAMNFGQRPFAYTPPTGFVALNTFNLPTPTIGATASSQANKYFDISLYTGTGSAQTITNSGGMQPDWVWAKARSIASGSSLADSVRGVSRILGSNQTSAEVTESAGVGYTSFNSNGFSLGTDATLGSTNYNTATYVAWQWRASGTTVTNTAGSITSTVSANTSSGFSVVTYTGNGTAGATVGHGLGVKPSMIIVKSRSGATDWRVYSSSLSATQYGALNLTSAFATATTVWNDTEPTSSVFTLGASSTTNPSGSNLVAYCFSEVAGYSKISSYTGNGSADGPFIFTGFRPKYVMIKRSDSGNDWFILDSSRNTYNLANAQLLADSSGAESTGSDCNVDFLSNGFKLRTALDASNGSGGTYIYACFAESPFKYANAR